MANLNGFLYSWNPAASSVPLSSDFLGMDLVGLVSSQTPPINILLPVLVGGTMWLTQKTTMTKPADPKQQSTNQIMLWMLPIMFGFFTFQFPTGLAIYILFSNIAGFVIQYFVTGRRNPFKSLATPDEQPVLAAVGRGTTGAESETSSTEETSDDADAPVHRENRRRSNRSRSRDSRSKSRRSRNRRR
jgi:membrane protein insertase Oxa1/YidC/SpoIIIJ